MNDVEACVHYVLGECSGSRVEGLELRVRMETLSWRHYVYEYVPTGGGSGGGRSRRLGAPHGRAGRAGGRGGRRGRDGVASHVPAGYVHACLPTNVRPRLSLSDRPCMASSPRSYSVSLAVGGP
jgi:hypothetical protein